MLRSQWEVTRKKAFMAPRPRHAPMPLNRLVRGIATACLLLALSVFGPGVATEPAWANGDFQLAGGQKVFKLQVPVGQSQVINLDVPFATAVVGDPETVDMAPLTERSLYILGRRIGTTNLTLFDTDERLMAVIDIEVTHDLAGLREALHQALPTVNVRVRTANGRIMLDGVVPDAVALDRILSISREFARQVGEDEEGRIINALSVAASQQVMLEVRMIEATRTLGRDLGVNWSVSGDGFRFSTLPGASLVSGGVPFGTIIADFLAGGARVDVLIQALEEKGIARRLAEPNLSALSGQPASFHAGGEFPVPVEREGAEGAVTTSTEFKPFGVRLNFTPTVLTDGVINLLIEPEVSEPDFANAVRGIPSVTTRRARTTVELRDGQSLAMAGLLQTNHSRNANQIPWLGDVPILGALFRSSGFQKNETELVVIVTPRLVQPVPPGVDLKTPIDNLRPSNDAELVLLGKLEVTKEFQHLVETGGSVRGPFGHMLDLPKVKHDAVVSK